MHKVIEGVMSVTNEEFQEIVLKQMQLFSENFKLMHEQFGKIDQRFEKMDQRFNQLEIDFSDLKEEVGQIKGQQHEHTDMMRALLHNQEVTNVKLEALELNTATKTSVEKIDSKLNVLNQRLFNQEAEVNTLKDSLQLVK